MIDPDLVPPWLARLFAAGRTRHVIAGVDDDDCAVIQCNNEYLIVTTDFLNSSPIAVQLGLGNWHTLGRLVVGANLSDLCGSGARPIALLSAVTLEAGVTMKDFRSLMRGIAYEASRHGVPVVGGDTKLGKSNALAAIAIGSADHRNALFLKNSARPGDVLWVSGPIGSCNAAVLALTSNDGSVRWRSWARDAICVPQVPLSLSRRLSDERLGRGGIDISDGLGADVCRLCRASRVGAIIEVDRIPIADTAARIAQMEGVPPWALAFGAGGDFQFAVTTSSRASERVQRLGFFRIGRITARRAITLQLSNGQTARMPRAGHRDVRRLSFRDEIRLLIQEAARVAFK